jgi:alanine racemase
MRHILNSAGMKRFSKYQFDMVRLGIRVVWDMRTACRAQLYAYKVRLLQYLLKFRSMPAGTTEGIVKKGNNFSTIKNWLEC